MFERLYLSAGLGTSWCPPGGVGRSGWGEECLDFPAQDLAPMTQTQQEAAENEMNMTQKFSGFMVYLES